MLRQRGTVSEVKVISEKQRTDIWGQFLTVRGEYTNMYCAIRHNCIQIREIFRMCPTLHWCGFSDSCTIVDVCSVPFRDGSGGVVIAVNDDRKEEYFLAYYSFKFSRIVKKISIRRKITKIAAILDATKKNEIAALHENLKNSPQLVAVGTFGGECYLVHFGIDLPHTVDRELRNPPFSSNICKPYNTDGRFYFRTENGATISKNADEVYVTAIAYLERCRTVLIGFSCGLFIAVNLLTAMDASYYFASSPVYSFACQEPTDDPRPVLYLWVAYSNGKQRGLQALMCVINFPNDEGKPASQWSFTELLIISYLKWFPENAVQWHSFRTVLKPLSSEYHASSNCTMERTSSADETFFRSNGTDSSRVLMTWITNESTVEGALFDLNAFYYKRLPREITFEESLVKHSPFLSVFTLPVSNDHRQIYLDCMINYNPIMQYHSPHSETNDLFIFAPSYSFEIAAFNGNREFTIAVPSMQKVVLKWLDENFDDAIGPKSDLACEYLYAVGLAKTSADTSDSLSPASAENASVIISSLLFDGETRNETLMRHIVACPDYATVQQLAALIWNEVGNAKQKLDELSEPWFDRIPRSLSAADLAWVRSITRVFDRAVELFTEISKRVPSERVADAAAAKYNMMASKSLIFYAKILLLFHRRGLIPCNNYTALAARMKAKLDDCRKRLPEGKKLYIINLLEEMRSACPNEIFWGGLEANEWYPPTLISALLSAVLSMKITDIPKQKLIAYFLLDYDNIVGKESKVFNYFKMLYRYEEQGICNQTELNWKIDNGFQEPTVTVRERRIEFTELATVKPVSELERLMKRPLLPNNREAQFIKESLLKQPDGVRQWNRFCLERKMFSRLLPPEQPRNGILTDRVDRWAAKVMKIFPPIEIDATFTRTVPPGAGKMMRDISSGQRVAALPYRSPLITAREKPGILFETPHRPRIIPKAERPETPTQPKVSVCDRRISGYERILPREELENVHRLLQTPTPRHRRVTSGLPAALNSYASPTAQRVESMPAPASILKTMKGRPEENLAAGVEPPSKTLRFDLPSASSSESENTATSIAEEQEEFEEGLPETAYADASNVLDSDIPEIANADKDTIRNADKEGTIESYFEQQEEEEDLRDTTGTRSRSAVVPPISGPRMVSFEEQSDSDVVEDREEETTDKNVVERHFEEQKGPQDLLDRGEVLANEEQHGLGLRASAGQKITSYEEQKDPGIISASEPTRNADSEEEQREGREIHGLPRGNCMVTRSTATSLLTSSTGETKATERSSKKINPITGKKAEKAVPLDVEKSSSVAKEISFEEEDESDPTSAEIEKSKRTTAGRKETSPATAIRRSPRRYYASGAETSAQKRETTPKHGIESSVEKDVSPSVMATRKSPRRRYMSGAESSTPSRETTPKHSARAGKETSPVATVVRKSPRRRCASDAEKPARSQETTPKRTTIAKKETSPPATGTRRSPRRRYASGVETSTRSREATPKRDIKAAKEASPSVVATRKSPRRHYVSEPESSAQSSEALLGGRKEIPSLIPKATESPCRNVTDATQKRQDPTAEDTEVRTRSSDSFQSSSTGSEMSSSSHRMLTRSAAKAAKLALQSRVLKKSPRKRLFSGTDSLGSGGETTPKKRSVRAVSQGRNSPIKKSALRRGRRALSEQTEGKSESGSTSKYGRLPLPKIDEIPTKRSRLPVGRKTVTQVLEERRRK